MASIPQTFSQLRAQKQIAFMPFIPAGYPDLATTAALIPALEKAGASIIEIGLPFSDPIADGPTIQQAFTDALSHKIKLADILRTVASARAMASIPLVAMGSYSLVFRYGLDRFIADAKRSGFDGLILPDLPPPEAEAVCKKVNAGGLDTILLVAPTTSAERRKQIGSLSTGFVYYLSVTGITGERTALPADLISNLQNLRSLTDRPICVGFGISTPDHLKQLEPHADGAIVGSAIVKRMQQHASQGSGAMVNAVSAYCRDLLAKVR